MICMGAMGTADAHSLQKHGIYIWLTVARTYSWAHTAVTHEKCSYQHMLPASPL